MTKAKVIYLRFDSDDVEGDQIRYLGSVLNKHRNEPSINFSIRFTYDIDGTSHWDGKIFIIDIVDGTCHLRLASKLDGSEGPVAPNQKYNYQNKEDWRKIAERVNMTTIKSPQNLIITFQQSISHLKAEDLHIALKAFQVADVMFV